MRFPPGQPGGSAGAAQRAPAVAPASAGAGIVVSLLYYPNRHRGAFAAPVVGCSLGSGDGLDEGPGFVFELEEVEDFDGSGFLWSVR